MYFIDKDIGVLTIWHYHRKSCFFSIRLRWRVEFWYLAIIPSQPAFPLGISPASGLYRRRKVAAAPVVLMNRKLNIIQFFWCHTFISLAFSMSKHIDIRIDARTAVVAGTCCEHLAVAEEVVADPWCSLCCPPSWSSSSSLAGVSYSVPCCCPRLLVIAGDWRVRVLPHRWILFCPGHFCPSILCATSVWRILTTDCAILVQLSKWKPLSLPTTVLTAYTHLLILTLPFWTHSSSGWCLVDIFLFCWICLALDSGLILVRTITCFLVW